MHFLSPVQIREKKNTPRNTHEKNRKKQTSPAKHKGRRPVGWQVAMTNKNRQ